MPRPLGDLAVRISAPDQSDVVMTEAQGIAILKEVVQLLEDRRIRYWLGRGRFRHFTLTQEFGDDTSDIDFHVLRSDEPALQDALADFVRRHFAVTFTQVGAHKLSVRKCSADIEFVYLDQDRDDPGMLFHTTVVPLRKRFPCPREVFGDRKIDMFGAKVSVPSEDYLPCVFGSRWRENMKGSGGVEI
jgi:hypothetical protein